MPPVSRDSCGAGNYFHCFRKRAAASSYSFFMRTVAVPQGGGARRAVLRVASVGFINARPLIAGLEQDPGLDLALDVPSRLLARIRSGTADVALLPVIDLQREPGLQIVPSGGIGCDG